MSRVPLTGFRAATFTTKISPFFIYPGAFKCHGNPSVDFNEAEMDRVALLPSVKFYSVQPHSPLKPGESDGIR